MTINPINLLNQLGFCLVILLISLVPFHFLLSEISVLTYYREFISFSLLFIFFVVVYLRNNLTRFIRIELLLFLIFPVLLAISAIYDPMIDLYGYSEGMANVTKSSSIDPRIYVLRKYSGKKMIQF